MLAAEASIVLDLVDAVVQNVKEDEEGKIVINIDCWKVWESLTSETLKLSQLTGDGGSIISRIIELDRNSKIEFECVHVNKKKE